MAGRSYTPWQPLSGAWRRTRWWSWWPGSTCPSITWSSTTPSPPTWQPTSWSSQSACICQPFPGLNWWSHFTIKRLVVAALDLADGPLLAAGGAGVVSEGGGGAHPDHLAVEARVEAAAPLGLQSSLRATGVQTRLRGPKHVQYNTAPFCSDHSILFPCV